MDFYAPIKLGFVELISIHYLVFCVCFLRCCLEATLNPPSENISWVSPLVAAGGALRKRSLLKTFSPIALKRHQQRK